MLMRANALPAGPYDWHPERVPRALYEARLSSVRAHLRARNLAGLIVSGSSFDDGALAWLTGFTPKLGPALAIVPLDGAPRLLFLGGPGMRLAAQKTTWVEDVAALRDVGRDIAAAYAAAPGAWALCADAGLSLAHAQAIGQALTHEPVDMTPAIASLREMRDAAIAPLIAEGALIFNRVVEALTASAASGTDRWSARLAAERLAHDAGAQDVRLRLSRRDDGPAEPVDPETVALPRRLAVALSVRHHGFWLWGRTWIGDGAPEGGAAVWGRVMTGLRAGASLATLRTAALPWRLDGSAVTHSIVGSALDAEAPLSGRTLSLCFSPPSHRNAALSALVDIDEQRGAHLLWAAAPLAAEMSP